MIDPAGNRVPRQPTDKERDLDAAYRRFAATADGERVLSDLLNLCGLHSDPFTRDSRTFYNLGRLSVAQHIVRRVGGETDLVRRTVAWLKTLNNGA